MKANRKFVENEEADMNMILAAIVMAIALAIGIIIVYNVLTSINASTIDTDLRSSLGESSDFKATQNATSDLITNVNTFYTVAPIALIVVAAVGILSYVLLLRRRG